MKKLGLFLISLSFLAACNSAGPSEEAQSSAGDDIATLKDEVMALHDKVMPEMTPMSKLQSQLLNASVGSADSITIVTTATELKYAKDAMMKWMHDYSNTWDEAWTNEEKAVFLKGEKEKMARIDELTQQALSNGQSMLEQLSAKTDSVPAALAE